MTATVSIGGRGPESFASRAELRTPTNAASIVWSVKKKLFA